MSSCKMAPLCFSACIQFLSGIFIFIQVSLGFSRDSVDAQNGKKRETVYVIMNSVRFISLPVCIFNLFRFVSSTTLPK